MFKTDNSLHVFVGPNSATENASFQNDVTAATAAGSGSIFVVDNAGVAHDNAIVAGEFFKIGQKHADGSVNFTPLLKFDNCTIAGKATAARAEQITTLAAIPDTANNRYVIRVNVTNDVDVYSEQSEQYLFEYTTGGTVASAEVVDDFVAQINAQGGLKDRLTAAKASATSITLTGKEQKWSLGLHTNTLVTFDVTLENFGAATNTETESPVPGSGKGRDIAELEWFGAGSAGAPYRQGVPNNANYVTLYADATADYDVMTINATFADPGYAVSGAGTGKCQVVLALPDDVNTTDGAQANTTFGLTAIFNIA